MRMRARVKSLPPWDGVVASTREPYRATMTLVGLLKRGSYVAQMNYRSLR